jgi:Ni/Co efflux regulator RcnB
MWSAFSTSPLASAIKEAPYVWAFIERSCSLQRRFAQHRASAKQCEKAIKMMAKRKNRIVFIDPKVWQAGIGVNTMPGEDIKERSRNYARYVLKAPERIYEDQDRADAYNLLEYALNTPEILQNRNSR